MVILRPTQKLRALLPLTRESFGESETALGDWYINRIVVDRRPLLLVLSAKALLPLLIPARDVRSIPDRLPGLVGALLRRLGVGRAPHRGRAARNGDHVYRPNARSLRTWRVGRYREIDPVTSLVF